MNLKCYFLFLILLCTSCQKQKEAYVCTPCNLPCDELIFDKPGICPHCNMKLIKNEVLILDEIIIKNGVGKFLVSGPSDDRKSITVHYYKSENFSSKSNIIFVLPGAGRNGADYRDAWIESAEKYNLLVLSLEYADKDYPGFWSYNLGGMMYPENIVNETYPIQQNPDLWIFNDFDILFDSITSQLNYTQREYDMFGHSAGGQILHRLAIFKRNSNANRIIAANSGWYTLPAMNQTFPYGLQGLEFDVKDINFKSNLTILLGDKDDADETRGQLRHTPEADEQGLHRFSRGNYFYNYAQTIAKDLEVDCNWNLKIIPNVGHDHKEMSKAAADYLYSNK